jgi:hypothetical protein
LKLLLSMLFKLFLRCIVHLHNWVTDQPLFKLLDNLLKLLLLVNLLV